MVDRHIDKIKKSIHASEQITYKGTNVTEWSKQWIELKEAFEMLDQTHKSLLVEWQERERYAELKENQVELEKFTRKYG